MPKPTMEDVAARAGVSRALVSLVMRDSPRVSDHARAAVIDAADALGYRPNLAARNLAARRTRTVGLVLNDLHNPFFAEMADGAHAAAAEHGYRVLLGSGFRRATTEQQAIETFLDLGVDGLVLASPMLTGRAIEASAASVPVVAISRSLRCDGIDTVNSDEAGGARQVVDHLVALGHRRITHIDGGRGAGSVARRSGFVTAMDEHGLPSDIEEGAFTEASGAAAAARISRRRARPTAIFAANDLTAVGVLQELARAGLRVPDDVSVVGFDNIALAALDHLSLTTVDQPRAEMGRRAVEALLERLDGGRTAPRRLVLPPTLCVRATTGPASADEPT